MGWNSCIKFGKHMRREKGNVCGMPKQFSYCQMLIDEDNDNGLVLVDFSFRPVDVLSSITCWLLNARRQDKKDVDLIYKFSKSSDLYHQLSHHFQFY